MSGHWEPVMQWVEDEDEEELEEEYDPRDEQEWENERLSTCTCGIPVWSNKQKRFVQVADCCCGNTLKYIFYGKKYE